MYIAHFGLREPPFGITPDTSLPSRRRAHAGSAEHAAGRGATAAKASSRSPAKSAPARRCCAASSWPRSRAADFVTGYIPNPYLEPRTLMLALADELGETLPTSADQHHAAQGDHPAPAGAWPADGKRVLLCLDEAQAMPSRAWRRCACSTNLETEKRKLLQIVLFGQPELNRKLAPQPISPAAPAHHLPLSPRAALAATISITTSRTACAWPATSAPRAVLARRRRRACTRPAAACRAWSTSWRTRR